MARGRKAETYHVGVGEVQTAKTEEFDVKVGDKTHKLTASYNEVSFPDISVATNFFGDIGKLLKAAAKTVNSAIQAKAKNDAKNATLGFEFSVEEGFKVQRALFIEKRGAEPTKEQETKIRERVRERLLATQESLIDGL